MTNIPQSTSNSQGKLPQTSNGTATLSLVMALTGVCFLPLAVMGLIFGLIAQSQTRRTGQAGRGTATAAVYISSVVLSIWIVGIWMLLIGGTGG